MLDPTPLFDAIQRAVQDGKLSSGAAERIRLWLTDPSYAEYASLVAEHVTREQWQPLDDVFWTVIPFGTGGRRGRMYPIGTNAINDRTIGESAQGLADYAREHFLRPDVAPACAIAYDTRHRSRHFAVLCAEIMAEAGFTVYFLDGYRSTPELSFLVRHKSCSCGIMVTASHNPPSDNAVKVYGPDGGQLLPPHDQGVIEQVMGVRAIVCRGLAEAEAAGRIVYCQDEIDRAFTEAVSRQAVGGPRALRIVYSPLHGVGASAVPPVLERAGFREVELFGPHAEPSGDFPNVPGHVSNPENHAVFTPIVEHARASGADLVMATDPDCDRLGCAAPESLQAGAPWRVLTGNQIGALLADFVLDARRTAGRLTPEHYVVKTLVTTELIRRVADAYGVRTVGDLLVGFKWIGGAIDQYGPQRFVIGCEESYGFLVGDHARDKDGAVAALLLAELAARCRAEGQTLWQRLTGLMERHGCHSELTVSVSMPGAEGMARMAALMACLRAQPPERLGGIRVRQCRDYLNGCVRVPGGSPATLVGPTGDLVFLDLEAEGNCVAVRPSGTEPKVKFYLFTYDAPGAGAVADVLGRQAERLAAMQRDLRQATEGRLS